MRASLHRFVRLGFSGSALLFCLGGAGAFSIVNAPPAAAEEVSTAATGSSCQLGNGVSHVIEILFDNVHFNRDNPNVPSDMEQLPALTNFIEQNGTLLSNDHTPLIAHTAVDSLSDYTGLYGDRNGVGIGNTYNEYNTPGGTAAGVDSSSAFTYWTDQIDDTKPSSGADTSHPNEVYSASTPAAGTSPVNTPPAPWVPFTRAGCSVGDYSTANMVLENSNDIPQVFGANSPEANELAHDDSFGDQTSADYEGVAVHCAKNDPICANASAVKYGQTEPSPTASADLLPSEPGGYSGYQALFGNRYVAPVLGSAAVNKTTSSGGFHTDANGSSYQVTNAAGNLVDLNGQEIDNSFTGGPGFVASFSPTAAQSLAVVADMQESGIPVTYAYISDLHDKKAGATGCTSAGNALGPGDPCYEAAAASYNQAFATFFSRLAADGITPANSLFVFTADEGDHFVGANAGRSIQPSCTPGGSVGITCSYPTGTIGEVSEDLNALVATETGDGTPFTVQPQDDSIYVNGQPGPNAAQVRQLEREAGKVTAPDPYAGTTEAVANYLADPTEEAILHFVDADPARTPTFTLFPKPDFFASSGTKCTDPTTIGNSNSCTALNSGFAWDHGYYAAEINNTWLGLVGPDVRTLGLNGNTPANGPNSAGPNSGNVTTPGSGTTGIWADHTDTQPTIMALVGLKDDYQTDGRVLSEVITPNAIPTAAQGSDYLNLAACYKQLDSSVGIFGTNTLEADTAALESGSASNDSQYQSFQTVLANLGAQRDALASVIKTALSGAAFYGTPIPNAAGDLSQCQSLLSASASLFGATIPPQVQQSSSIFFLPTLLVVGCVPAAGLRRRARRVA